jgi:DNA-binding winged helix-turn-helix (wHTH) protein
VVIVYQAVPQSADAPSTPVRVVLVIDVPRHLEASAADAARLADEFGTTLSHFIPGVRARKAVVSVESEERPPTGLTVDLANRRVSIDGRPIRLAYREFQLFAHLAAQPHRTVSRTTLLTNVWNDRHPARGGISERTVDTHIRRLRTKLGDHSHVLTTVRGRGYRFDPGVDVQLRTLRRVVS